MPDNMGEEIAFGDNLETENRKDPCGFKGIHYGLGCGSVALKPFYFNLIHTLQREGSSSTLAG
jgi:hypothetical protein